MIKRLECPFCKLELIKRQGSYGAFYGCPNFPECSFTLSITESSSIDESYIIKDIYNIKLPIKMAKLLLKTSKEHVVYIIKINKTGLIKIGKSIDYISRLRGLDSEHGGIVPILLMKTRFHSSLEVFLHEVFDDFLRDKKEYFDIPPEYLIEIPKLKTFLGEKVKIMAKEKIALSEILNNKKHYEQE